MLSREVQRLKEHVEQTQSVAATPQPSKEVGRGPPAISVSEQLWKNKLIILLCMTSVYSW